MSTRPHAIATESAAHNAECRVHASVLRDLLNRLPSLVYRQRADARGTLDFLSDACIQLTGYAADCVLFVSRASFETIIHSEDRMQVRTALERALQERTAFEIQYRIINAHGEIRWVIERGAAVTDEQGSVAAVEGIIDDITSRKTEEQRYRALFENALEGIFRTTEGGQYLEANAALARVYGFDSPEELVRELRDIDHQLYVEPERRRQFMQEIRARGVVNGFESQVYKKNGEIIWISENARAVLDQRGNVAFYEGTVEDITQRKEFQQHLIDASEAAAAANRAKTAFVANVSHEIRTPMNGITGMTNLLLETSLDPTQQEYAETIRKSADSLLTIINDLLDFSKIEAGKLDIENIEMDLRANVEDVGAMMGFQAAAKELELIVNVHPNLPDRVSGDPQRIRQCLINLVGNAIKFTRQGEVAIEVSAQTRSERSISVRFEVRDTGIGIAPGARDALFEPFVQADSSTTRHFGGTGLGLSIVRRLVEMMGGELGLTSELGKGSAFWFTLPFGLLADADAHPLPDPCLLHKRILVVDDNATSSAALATQLQHAGCDVQVCASGERAIEAMHAACARQRPFAAVLADFQILDMEGAALGERINADSQLSSARLIMLTSRDRHGDIAKFRALGFAGYLPKPVRLHELLGCLRTILARESREWHMQSQPIVTRSLLTQRTQAGKYNGRVLLIEDNAVNQQVARRFLERLGCTVVSGMNGAEAVRLYEPQKYDLVLMDLQMPHMDGFAATRRIRDAEGWRPRTPIVALTANAMAGQVERCLSVGMDGFLTKPLSLERLSDVLEQFGLAVTADLPESEPKHMTPLACKPVDMAGFNELTAGDTEFAAELKLTFASSSASVIAEIQQAVHKDDRSAIARAAHKLKGAAANIRAGRLASLAASLDSGAATMSQNAIVALVGELAAERERVIECLKEDR